MTDIEERELLARIDQAHADIAVKQEQLRHMPVVERDYLTRIDLAHADIVFRQEQLSQMKTFPLGKFEGWKLAFAGMTAGATLFAAGAAFITVLLHWLGKLT